MNSAAANDTWQTKPTDRFILKWIKCHLSARITPHLLAYPQLRPWMITLGSSGLGVCAGVLLALGLPFLAGTLSACAQVLDGVDGQLARLTGRQSKGGAFWDSVLDRYSDGALVIGSTVYCLHLETLPTALILVAGSLALIGSNLISYSTARAASLNLDLGPPTLASKGTRTTILVLAAWFTVVWPAAPMVALFVIALAANGVVVKRLVHANRDGSPLDT